MKGNNSIMSDQRETSGHLDRAPDRQTRHQLNGMEYLQALQAGELPANPIAHLVKMQLETVEKGRVIFLARPDASQYNGRGTVNGGIMSTWLDAAMGAAVHSMLRAGTDYTTVELKVNFVRAITEHTGQLYCEGKVIHIGGRLATVEGRLNDRNGQLYAHGTSTCILLRP
jgi:uncharacterized protein (TIGR00369 family)